MPYTRHRQYILMQNMLQMKPGQSRRMTIFRKFQMQNV
jgi:hypothetical protein